MQASLRFNEYFLVYDELAFCIKLEGIFQEVTEDGVPLVAHVISGSFFIVLYLNKDIRKYFTPR